jgi:prepilin-type N-terminal cleavage/methylation domain-containing protein
MMERSGFTLVEVIVVVSIISILVSVALINMNDARAIARDSTRAASLQQLQLALETYKTQYGQYPDEGCGNSADGEWSGPGPHSGVFATCTDYITGNDFVPDFIAELPTDPLFEDQENRGFVYRVEDFNGQSNGAYKLMVYDAVESITVGDYSDPLARCPSSGGNCGVNPDSATYAVYSSGAEDW